MALCSLSSEQPGQSLQSCKTSSSFQAAQELYRLFMNLRNWSAARREKPTIVRPILKHRPLRRCQCMIYFSIFSNVLDISYSRTAIFLPISVGRLVSCSLWMIFFFFFLEEDFFGTVFRQGQWAAWDAVLLHWVRTMQQQQAQTPFSVQYINSRCSSYC